MSRFAVVRIPLFAVLRKLALLALFMAAAVLACSLVLFLGAWLRASRVRALRPAALQATMRRARPVIEAIEAFAAERGEPPRSLEQLLPRYLPRLPEPGPVARDGWRYSVGEEAPPEAGGWSLWVVVRDDHSPDPFSFGDVFVYHPGGTYPDAAYGGCLERVGRWGYYWE